MILFPIFLPCQHAHIRACSQTVILPHGTSASSSHLVSDISCHLSMRICGIAAKLEFWPNFCLLDLVRQAPNVFPNCPSSPNSRWVNVTCINFSFSLGRALDRFMIRCATLTNEFSVVVPVKQSALFDMKMLTRADLFRTMVQATFFLWFATSWPAIKNWGGQRRTLEISSQVSL